MPAQNVRRCVRLGAAMAMAAVATACASNPAGPSVPASTPASSVTIYPVMAAARVSGQQVSTWFNTRTPRPSGTYAATVPVDALAQLFIEEGAAEGVAGDVAFVQSIVETGWFRFSGLVPASYNNFAGIGATDTNPNPAQFVDARTGVRAQIQHLRAYADPTATACTVPPLHQACVDLRFALVVPKGRAPTWNEMGNGNWATATTYAATILQLYAELLQASGLR